LGQTVCDDQENALPARNFGLHFLEVAGRRPDAPGLCFHRDGQWQTWSYGQVADRSRRIAAGLLAEGLDPGDRVSILSDNRPEWALVDLGCILAGMVVVPIYSSMTPKECAYHLDHSGAVLIFVEDEDQARKIEAVRDELPDLRAVVRMTPDGAGGPDLEGFADPDRTATNLDRIETTAGLADPATPLTIIYTSGTTGPPKGAVLTHGNIMGTVALIEDIVPDFESLTHNLSFLPLAHTFERMGGHFLPLYYGRTICYSRGLDAIAEDFQAVAPVFATGVPRVYEKIYARILAEVEQAGGLKQKVFWWAVGVGGQKSRRLMNHQPIPMVLRIKIALAHRLVFAKLHQALGGSFRYFVSGGAPLAKEIAEFFHAAGVLILEGWGATETSAPATINRPDNYRFGSVGPPLPEVEVKIAPDGELMVKGVNVFAGYYRDPEATRAALTEDGWWLSGDLGRVDEDGFFYITDRKKEIIVTATGKNVPPANLENRLKQRRFISNCLVHGDRRKYLTALITLDPDDLAVARGQGALPPDEAPESSARVMALVQAEVDAVNQDLAPFEQIKYFRICPEDFSVESGELTQTLKLKRRVIEARYRDELDGMYPIEPTR
jgi:long-chain acyl-CoA synthetase